MIYKDSFARQIAEYLLEIQAVTLSPEKPYTWSSGWKSPIYCDNRLILGYPDIRDYIFAKLKEVIHSHFKTPCSLAGVATAGIPAASVLAHDLHWPMVYVRSSSKGHGRQNRIEGTLKPGSSCIVVEDLISTGGSSLEAIDVLNKEGHSVIGVIAVFSYGFERAHNAFADLNYPLITLSDYSVLSEVALKRGDVDKAQMETLESWRESPESWGK